MQKEMADLFRLIIENKGKIIGTLLGLFIGWLTIRYGVWKALFVVISIVAGYLVGSRLDRDGDDRPNFRDLVDRFSGPEE